MDPISPFSFHENLSRNDEIRAIKMFKFLDAILNLKKLVHIRNLNKNWQIFSEKFKYDFLKLILKSEIVIFASEEHHRVRHF